MKEGTWGRLQVRGDHGEVVNLLVSAGGKVRATSGALIDLQTTQLSRCGAAPMLMPGAFFFLG